MTHHPRHEGGAQHRHDVRAFFLSSSQQENPENVEANVSPRFIGNCKQCKETDTGKQVNTLSKVTRQVTATGLAITEGRLNY